ncbi:MAG: transcriptional regulator PpsR [Rubrivivax sp.]
MSRAKSGPPSPGDVDARTASRLLGASADIALVLDLEGHILDVTTQAKDLADQGARKWRGRHLSQTVTPESREKVEALLQEARQAAEAARWRQVTHPVPDGDGIPMMYSAIRLADDGSGPGGARIIAFGRDMRAMVALQQGLLEAQQTMEQDYWRFREAETRFRHLFETSSDALLVVDGGSLKVLEANPAARSLCAPARSKLVGSALSSLVEAGHGERLQDLLAAARSVGRQDPLRTRLAGDGREVLLSASVFRQEQSAFLMVRFAPAPAEAAMPATGLRTLAGTAGVAQDGGWEAILRAFVHNSPDGLVFCEPGGKLVAANRAFLALAQLATEEQARGQPLDRWVGRTGVELGVLISNLRQRGQIGLFVTTLRGEYGAQTEVEISGATLSVGEDTVLAFAVRDVERRLKGSGEAAGPAMPRSVGELTELVGRTPLKEIVSETTDLIEQLCIETALQMTQDNRASAATLLGLSRQSLYVKLRRFGLGNLGSSDEELPAR